MNSILLIIIASFLVSFITLCGLGYLVKCAINSKKYRLINIIMAILVIAGYALLLLLINQIL